MAGAVTSMKKSAEIFKNMNNGRIRIEYIRSKLKPDVWEKIKEKILETFRKPEWREIVRLTLENPWTIDWARDFGEYKYYLRGVIADYMRKSENKEFYEKLYRMLMDEDSLNYLEQTVLVKLSEWGIISRPDTRSEGSIYYLSDWYKFEKLAEIDTSRYKSLIYVEKKAPAESIASTLYIIGHITGYGKGYPTWKMRQVAQQGKLYVFCDADWAGTHIYKVFAEGAIRLKKISGSVLNAKRRLREKLIKEGYTEEDGLFLLEDASKEWVKLVVSNSKRLGLDFEDAENLGLPWEIEPKCKEGDERKCRRYELQSLIDLKMRYGIENPYLAYVAYRLRKVFKEGLKPLLPDPVEAYSDVVIEAIEWGIRDFVKESVANAIAATGIKDLFEGLKLRRDLAEMLAERVSIEVSNRILKKELKPQIEDYMLRLDIGLPIHAENPDDFEEKFWEWSGANKIEELLG
ncbi:hypothetical protein Igag_1967 [Ignisphaera aggregans DSM 17230]|uniref:Uncharacterized protein n=1 Tax=Ignisphaera aggregans (strain DSM 17230 / JCM 13409 / AQ1.S1) TaxID=583356 RepID=E0STH3_IGNAA|nr:hypothetical protein Igag_1967 [Ignisphaera aggregans DSM 17230]